MKFTWPSWFSLQQNHNEYDGISNHQRLDYLLNRLFRCRSKKTSKLRVTGICEGNSPVTGEFPTQRASNVENISIWWHHHVNSLRPSGKLIIIGSNNGLSPGRRQAIIWTNIGILSIGPLATNFNEILIGIQTFSLKKMRLKLSSGKWCPFCLGLNVLMIYEMLLLRALSWSLKKKMVYILHMKTTFPWDLNSD